MRTASFISRILARTPLEKPSKSTWWPFPDYSGFILLAAEGAVTGVCRIWLWLLLIKHYNNLSECNGALGCVRVLFDVHPPFPFTRSMIED